MSKLLGYNLSQLQMQAGDVEGAMASQKWGDTSLSWDNIQRLASLGIGPLGRKRREPDPNGSAGVSGGYGPAPSGLGGQVWASPGGAPASTAAQQTSPGIPPMLMLAGAGLLLLFLMRR